MEALHKAATARLQETWPQGRVYPYGGHKDAQGTPYIALSLSSPRPAHADGAGRPRSRAYRLSGWCVGRTDGEIQRAFNAMFEAFLGHCLVVPGWDFGPPDPEEMVTASPRRDPDGEFGGQLVAIVDIPLHGFPKE